MLYRPIFLCIMQSDIAKDKVLRMIFRLKRDEIRGNGENFIYMSFIFFTVYQEL